MEKIFVAENLAYTNPADDTHKMDLYIPQTRANGILFFYFHGGGLESGDKKDQEGLYRELASMGYIVASANYRMYQEAVFPDFIDDAACAVAWGMEHIKEYASYERVVIGGISAGAYLSMMLHFNKKYLENHGVDESKIAAYVFDAGQPTTHYKVLKERGQDPNAIRVDEAAPLFYVAGEEQHNEQQAFLFVIAECDIKGRKEQNELLIQTMELHNYPAERMQLQIVPGYEHAGYVDVIDENGNYPYATRLHTFLTEFIGL